MAQAYADHGDSGVDRINFRPDDDEHSNLAYAPASLVMKSRPTDILASLR